MRARQGESSRERQIPVGGTKSLTTKTGASRGHSGKKKYIRAGEMETRVTQHSARKSIQKGEMGDSSRYSAITLKPQAGGLISGAID